jgi:hypothetical protein
MTVHHGFRLTWPHLGRETGVPVPRQCRDAQGQRPRLSDSVKTKEEVMKVELPGESKAFGDIIAGECFAFSHRQITSVCMKVEWLSAESIAVLWSAADDWTVPHLIVPTELAGSILHSLPSAVFIASSDAKDIRTDRTRHEYAPGFLIKTPTGQPLIAVKGLQREHGIPVIDVETGKASGMETDNLTFFTSWRIATKVLDKYETVCAFPSHNATRPR